MRLRNIYRRSKRELSRAILAAKKSSWNELLSTVDADPWGLPYKIVMRKLATGSNLTTSLDESILNDLFLSLFPDDPILSDTDWVARGFLWDDRWTVAVDEVSDAIREKRNVNTAPGLDGIRAIIFKWFPQDFLEAIAQCFTSCLIRGIFPRDWKVSRLVLIPKRGDTSGGTLPKARPICLLNEMGKLFERVIANRMRNFMLTDSVADLAQGQYGFRKARSTCDALLFVKDLIKGSFGNKEIAIAVGLDIKNAFNSLPWRKIRRALSWRKRFPSYICRIIKNYLSGR